MNNESIEKQNDVNEYDVFKKFIKNEILRAIDEEDYERMKILSSILELLSQVRKSLGTSDKSKRIKQEVFSESDTKAELVEGQKTKEVETEKVNKLRINTSNTIKGTIEDRNKNTSTKSMEKIEQVKQKSSNKKIPSSVKSVKGLKTPEKAFVLPVIDSLIEFGGTAPRKQVVERVFEKMKHVLNEYDFSPMSYNKYVPRWKDTLHWVRLNLIKRGILARGTEKGIWSLTEYGKAYYAMHKEKVENNTSEQSHAPEAVEKPAENSLDIYKDSPSQLGEVTKEGNSSTGGFSPVQ